MTFRLALVTLATMLVAGGCKDSLGVADFNPAMSGQKVEQALGAVDNNQAVQSLNVMDNALTLGGAPSGSLFPTAALGKTFIYNTQTGKYEASDLAGAPANGVRYLLYAVDRAQRVVITPLQQIGTLDLTDKSTPAAAIVGIKAVVNNVTVLDYDASGSLSAASFSFTAKGYVTDAGNRVDFDLSQSASNGIARVDYKLTGPNVSLEIAATGTSSEITSATLTVTENKDKLEVASAGNAQSSTGTVKYNGTTLANIAVMGDQDPVFTGVNGRVFSADDLAGLKTLFNQVDAILNRFDDVLVPAYFVFGLN